MPDAHDSNAIRHRVLIENTAQAVHKQLRELDSSRSDAEKRWIWELMQNALDANADSVRVEYDGKNIAFLHNGERFTDDQLCHLIYHGSTKAGDEKTIGRFGSGFLATHLLSYTVNIAGYLHDGRFFDFPLQRNPESVSALKSSMDAAWEHAHSLHRDSNSEMLSDKLFTTRFEYPIGANNNKSVEDVLEDLNRYGPLLLVFNRKLSDITVQSTGTTFTVKRQTPERLASEGQEMVCIQQRTNDLNTQQQYMYMRSDKGAIAIPLVAAVNGFSCKLLADAAPRLFIGFPLIGTDNFCIPVIGNSFHFSATEHRDGVHLGKSDNDDNKNNEQIVSELRELYISALRDVAAERFGDICNLTTLPPHKDRKWLGEEWLREHLECLILRIRNTPAVLCSNDTLAPKDAVLPFAQDVPGVNMLWGLLSDLRDIRSKLPVKSEAIGWCNAARSWMNALGRSAPDRFREAFGARNLARHIHDATGAEDNAGYGATTIGRLDALLVDGIDSIDWLNRLYVFLCDYEPETLQEYKLVLSQGKLLDRRDNLYRDMGVDDELKTISDDILKLGIKRQLRDTRLRCLADRRGKGDYRNDDVARRILEKLEVLANQDDPGESFFDASARLFAWIVRRREMKYLRNYPAFSLGFGKSDRRVIRLQKMEHASPDLLLAPPKAWPADLRPFVDLFPPQGVLADNFFYVLDDREMWKDLEKEGVVRMNVLFRREERIKFEEYQPDEPLPNSDSTMPHEAKDPVVVTDIAQFRTERIRNSRSRARLLLKFIFEWLSVRDDEGLSISEAACVCGEKHRYYPAAWLRQVVRNRWVPIDKDRRDSANARSIAQLIDKDRIQALMGAAPGVDRVFEAMHIGKLALGIQAAVKDGVQAGRMEAALAGILSSAGGGVIAMAEDLRDDEGLLKVIEKRRSDRHQATVNRRLGECVENLVREFVEKQGFTVSRTRVGSDFEIENDYVDFDDNEEMGVEITKEDRKWLMEIKATAGTTVRMTSVQARTAVDRGSRFVLCVVPVQLDDENSRNLDLHAIERDMRFVLDIGGKVGPLCQKLYDIEGRQRAAQSEETGGFKLEITGSTARIVVASSVWSEGVRLEDISSCLV